MNAQREAVKEDKENKDDTDTTKNKDAMHIAPFVYHTGVPVQLYYVPTIEQVPLHNTTHCALCAICIGDAFILFAIERGDSTNKRQTAPFERSIQNRPDYTFTLEYIHLVSRSYLPSCSFMVKAAIALLSCPDLCCCHVG